MSEYLLAKHAYLCSTSDHVVILDLRNDRYLALSHSQSDALNLVVAGWPRRNSRKMADHSGDTTAAITRLLHANLLTTELSLGKDATPTAYVVPSAPLLETALLHTLLEEAPPPPRIMFRDFSRLTFAYFRAVFRLRLSSLEQIVHDANARRVVKAPAIQPNTQAARHLVAKFRLMRALFYTPRGKCLLDSYVLVEFLAKYQVYPAWIFGVQTRPFTAHCWVQGDDLVFNDTVEHVESYVPIMVV